MGNNKSISLQSDSQSESLCSTRARTKISDLSQLERADHVAFWRVAFPVWHHAIVLYADTERENLLVRHYNNTAQEYIQANSSVKATIREEWVTVNCATDNIYRFDYEPGECLDPDEVIRRTEERLGEKNYNLFSNNCEHFARWCKSGQDQSNQVEDLKSRAITSFTELGLKLAKTITQDSIELALKQGGKMAFRRAGAEVAGAVTVLVVELYEFIKEVKREWDLYKDGDIDFKEFCKVVANEFGKSSSSTLGAIIGDIVGQIVIPIPFLGGLVGGLVGWIIGKCLAGPWIGRLMACITDALFILFKNTSNTVTQRQITQS